jgi:hypothetical protein
MAVKVARKKNLLKIAIPIEKPVPSKSGKTLVVASTHGLLSTDVKYKGRHIVLLLNAFIYPGEEDLRRRARATMLRIAGKLK